MEDAALTALSDPMDAFDLVGASVAEDAVMTQGHTIYLPFAIGDEDDSEWGLWGQILAAVHAHQHVVQSDRGGFGYSFDYFTDLAARARYETEAARAELEVQIWRFGNVSDVSSWTDALLHLGCRPADVAVATKALLLSAVSILHGATLTEAGRAALALLPR